MGKVCDVDMKSNGKGIFNIDISLADIDLDRFKKENGLFSPFDIEKLAAMITCSKEMFVGPYRVTEKGNILKGWRNNLLFFKGEFDVLKNSAGLLAFVGGGEKQVFAIYYGQLKAIRMSFDRRKGLFLQPFEIALIKKEIYGARGRIMAL